MNNKTNKLLITGAGFSWQFGFPHTNDLIKILKNPDKSLIINVQFKNFRNEVINYFNSRKDVDFELWNLEDMFDYLSLNINKNVANKIHKMLSYLIFFIIEEKFKVKSLNCLANSDLLDSNILTTNWDIFLDQILRNNFPKLGDYTSFKVDYGIPIELHTKHKSCDYNPTKTIKLIKFHGSANWAYCKKCKKMYYAQDNKLALYSNCGLSEKEVTNIRNDTVCEECKQPLDIVAKFYGKNKLKSPQEIFSKIKKEAKKLLKNNNNWLFIGYSFPDDDVEFINLLKNSCNSKKEIDIVYMCNDRNKKFELNCRNIFIDANRINLFPDGLENYIENLNQ